MKTARPSLLLLGALLALTAHAADTPPVPVVVTTARSENFAASLTATGTVVSRNDARISSAVGGTLAVSLINGFKPAIGNTFDLLDWGLLNGTFLSITLPTLSGAQWDTSQLYTTGVLSVVAGPGDFNADGAVDAADYVLWRKGLGTTYTQNDYTAWRSNFGQSSGSGAARPENSLSAVPEPHSTLLLLVGLGCCAARRRRNSVVAVFSPQLSFPRRGLLAQ